MAGDPALDRSISPKKRPRYEQPVKSLEFLKKENAQRSFLRTKVCPDDLSRMIQTQKVFSLYNPPTESFPCARTIPYAGCARARFWKWNKKSMTTQKIEKVTEPVKKVDMVHRSYQQWLPNLWKIRKRVSEYIVEGMMKETNRQSRLDTHRMSKQYRTDTRASPIPSVMRKPYDALGDSEPRTAKTRDMRVAVGSEVVSLEISGPEQGIDVDWNTVWLEEMVVQDRAFTEDESSSDSQSTSMAMEEVSAEDVSQDSLHPKNESNRTSVFSQSNITAALMKPHEEEKQPRLRPLDLSDRLSKSKQKLQQETGVASCRVRGEKRKTASVNPKPNPLLFSVMMGFPPNEPVPRVIATPTTLPQCASPLDTLAFAACSAAASEANSAAPSPAIQTENLGEVIEKALRISPPTGASLQQQLGLLTIAKDKRSTEEANGDRNRRNSIEKQSRGSVVGPSRQYSKLVPAPLPSQKLRRVSEKAEGAFQKTVSRSVTSVSKSGPGINQVSLEATRSKFQELIQKRKNLEPAKKLAKPPVSTLGLLQPTDWFAQYGLEAEYSPPPNETDAPVKTLLSKSVMSPRTAQNRTQDKKETRAFERDHPVSSNLSPRKMDQGGSSRGALRITISPERLGSSRKLIPSSEEMLSPSRRPIVYRTLTPEEKRSPNPLSLVQKKMGSEEWYDATAVQDTLTVKTSPGDLKTPKKVSSGPLDRQHLEPLKGSKQRILPAGTVTQRINLEEFPTVSAKKRGRPRKYPLAPVEQESLDKQNTEAVQKMKSSVTEPDLSPVLAPQIKIFVAAEKEKHLPLKKRKVSYSTDPEQEISQPSPKKGRGRPPKTASRLENVPEALEKRKTRSPEKALMESTTVGSTAAGNSPSLEQSLRGRRRSGRKADMESSEKMRRYGSRNKMEEADMSAPADTERSDAGNWSSTAGPSRESSVADDSASEKTSFSSSYANMKTENKYMMAPKKYLLRRAQTEQADEPVPEQTPPLPDPVAHPEVFRQPSLDDIHLLTPPPVETSPDIMILEPPEKTPEEVKREAEESFEEPVPFQVTDYEYDEDGVDDPPIGAPVIYACDFSVIDKGQGLNLDWAPFPPDSARVDATCFSHLVLNLARGQKFSILPRMTNRYSLIREEYDLLMFIIEDAEVNPMYLKGDNYTLACEDPRALFEQAVVDLSGPCLQLLTRDKDPVVAKKQVLTSYKIREVIDVFLKKKNELLIGLATEAFGNTDGPEFQLLKEQFELVMKAIQIRMCDSLMGLAEETKQWDPTVNTLKRRFETFLFGWRSFIHQGGAIKCFYERFKDEMHPRVAETTNKCISITETYTRKIASFLQEGPVARVNQLVENFEKDRKVFTDKFPRSITNVETTRSASHRHGCKDPCNIFFSEVDLLDYHKELHKYKPYDCNICYLSFSHELSLYLHYLERHTIDVLTRDIRIAS